MEMQQLWYAWKAADEAWHNALVRAFGKSAGDRRYDSQEKKLTTHPDYCLEAEARWDNAGAAYKRFMGYSI
jgi:hypothetical protein